MCPCWLAHPKGSATSSMSTKSLPWLRAFAWQFKHPILLNADHTHSLERAVEAAQAGYDMIGFDAFTMRLLNSVSSDK